MIPVQVNISAGTHIFVSNNHIMVYNISPFEYNETEDSIFFDEQAEKFLTDLGVYHDGKLAMLPKFTDVNTYGVEWSYYFLEA